jgi:hypothetical protein
MMRHSPIAIGAGIHPTKSGVAPFRSIRRRENATAFSAMALDAPDSVVDLGLSDQFGLDIDHLNEQRAVKTR